MSDRGILMSAPRSNRAEVRNPVLALPSASKLQGLDLAQRAALRAIMLDLAADARSRSDKCWRTHKAPMALYWKCVAVYAGHIGRALRSQNGNIDGGQG